VYLMLKARGFTLIELMVVVIVIGVLLSIAVPRFSDARKKTMFNEGVTILTTIVSAVKMVKIEGGGDFWLGQASPVSDWKDLLHMNKPSSTTWNKFGVEPPKVFVESSDGTRIEYTFAVGDDDMKCVSGKCYCKKWNFDSYACLEK